MSGIKGNKSGGGSTTTAARVSNMPKSVKEMIQTIKEIAGGYSDDEIHAMLKECSMDPNEAAQKLLSQDPFHQVTRKRDKKKQVTTTATTKESRTQQGRGRPVTSTARANPPSRPSTTPTDTGDARKQNGGLKPGPPSSTLLTSSSTAPNHPNNDQLGPPTLVPPVSLLGLYSSASDPVLHLSLEPPPPASVAAIKLPRHNSSPTHHPQLTSSFNHKPSPEEATTSAPTQSQPFETNHTSDTPHHLSPPANSTSTPSSNYGTRSQQHIASQKVGPSKEWKPKPTNPNSAPASVIVATSEVGSIIVNAVSESLPTLSAPVSEKSASKLQQKFDELHLSHNQHVIIPNHLQVPEAERTGLSFGSFDADFGLTRCYNNGPDALKNSTPLSDSSQDVEVMVEEPYLSNQIEPSTTPEGDYADHSESPKNVPENLSNIEADVSSSSVREYDQSKQETSAPVGNPQYSVVHTAPNYNYGFMPPILGTQFAPFDTSEAQSRDTSRIPSFVVPQPFDPSASYYTQYCRPSTDGDGRFSPFLAPGAANKYNGNIAMLSPPQSGQPQESGNSLVHSTAGPTPLATQAAGVVQSSLAVTQQPVPVFRQPSGVHLPHYPPNYIPYSQYFSPFYVPPQTIHHYLTNPSFQQAPASSVYPPPAPATGTGVKFSLPQYKPVTNSGNPTHVGVPSGYAPYSSSPTGYSPSPAASTTNSTGNEELSASQYKENSVYITGQQSEGAAVWIPAQGRDISGLQPSSFYSLSPQGQHVTFTPTQAGHGAFAGIYHPTQTMGAAASIHPLLQQSQSMGGAVEMVGPPAGAYQQPPQRAQMSWTNNY